MAKRHRKRRGRPSASQLRMLLSNSTGRPPVLGVSELARLSFEARFEDASEMLALAQLAVEQAATEPADVAAFAHCHLGNALRVNGRFAQASDAFDRAAQLYGGAYPLVLSFRASLHQDQREFGAALACLAAAGQITEDPEERAVLVLKVANVLDLTGQHMTAAELVKDILDSLQDPNHIAAAIQAIAHYLTKAGATARALFVLRQGAPLLQKIGPLGQLRIAWCEGRLALSAGDYEMALSRLSAAREGFATREMVQETALLSIDISLALAKQRRLGQARLELRGVPKLLANMGVASDALAAKLVEASLASRTLATFVTHTERLARELAAQPRWGLLTSSTRPPQAP